MQRIDVTPELAEQALVTLAAHVPLHVEIGRPMLAGRDDDGVMLVTAAGTWWVRPGMVTRLVELPDGRVESAAWSGGAELYRTIDAG